MYESIIIYKNPKGETYLFNKKNTTLKTLWESKLYLITSNNQYSFYYEKINTKYIFIPFEDEKPFSKREYLIFNSGYVDFKNKKQNSLTNKLDKDLVSILKQIDNKISNNNYKFEELSNLLLNSDLYNYYLYLLKEQNYTQININHIKNEIVTQLFISNLLVLAGYISKKYKSVEINTLHFILALELVINISNNVDIRKDDYYLKYISQKLTERNYSKEKLSKTSYSINDFILKSNNLYKYTVNSDLYYNLNKILFANKEINIIKMDYDISLREIINHINLITNKSVKIVYFDLFIESYLKDSQKASKLLIKSINNSVIIIKNIEKYDLNNSMVRNLVEFISNKSKNTNFIFIESSKNKDFEEIFKDKRYYLINMSGRSELNKMSSLINAIDTNTITSNSLLTVFQLSLLLSNSYTWFSEAIVFINNNLNTHLLKDNTLHLLKIKYNLPSVKTAELLINSSKRLYKTKQYVVGQDTIIQSLVRIIKNNLKNVYREKPLVSTVLIAPECYGKKFLVNQLHYHLYGTDKILIYDCKHSNNLYNQIIQFDTIDTILLRNIEFIDIDSKLILLEILNTGKIVDGLRIISFQNSSIFLTTTKSSDIFSIDDYVEFSHKKDEIIKNIESILPKDLVDCVNKVLVFDKYKVSDIVKIIDFFAIDMGKKLSTDEKYDLAKKVINEKAQ